MKRWLRRSKSDAFASFLIGAMGTSIILSSFSAHAADKAKKTCSEILTDSTDKAPSLREQREDAVISAAFTLNLLYENQTILFFRGVADPIERVLMAIHPDYKNRVKMVDPKRSNENWPDFLNRIKSAVPGLNTDSKPVVAIVPSDKNGFASYAKVLEVVSRNSKSGVLLRRLDGPALPVRTGFHAFSGGKFDDVLSVNLPLTVEVVKALRDDYDELKSITENNSTAHLRREFFKNKPSSFGNIGTFDVAVKLSIVDYVQANIFKHADVPAHLFPKKDQDEWGKAPDIQSLPQKEVKPSQATVVERKTTSPTEKKLTDNEIRDDAIVSAAFTLQLLYPKNTIVFYNYAPKSLYETLKKLNPDNEDRIVFIKPEESSELHKAYKDRVNSEIQKHRNPELPVVIVGHMGIKILKYVLVDMLKDGPSTEYIFRDVAKESTAPKGFAGLQKTHRKDYFNEHEPLSFGDEMTGTLRGNFAILRSLTQNNSVSEIQSALENGQYRGSEKNLAFGRAITLAMTDYVREKTGNKVADTRSTSAPEKLNGKGLNGSIAPKGSEEKRVQDAVVSAAFTLQLLYPENTIVFFPGVSDSVRAALQSLNEGKRNRIVVTEPKRLNESWSSYVMRMKSAIPDLNNKNQPVIAVIPSPKNGALSYIKELAAVSHASQSGIIVRTMGYSAHGLSMNGVALDFTALNILNAKKLGSLDFPIGNEMKAAMHASFEELKSRASKRRDDFDLIAAEKDTLKSNAVFARSIEISLNDRYVASLYSQYAIHKMDSKFLESLNTYPDVAQLPAENPHPPPTIASPAQKSQPMMSAYGGDYDYYDNDTITAAHYSSGGYISSSRSSSHSYQESPEEKERRLEREKKRQEEEAERKRAEEQEKANLVSEIVRDIKAGDERSILLNEAISAEWFDRISREAKVSVLVGNAYEDLSPEKTHLLTDLVTRLVEQNRLIVFDADARSAKLIAKLTGKKGIGVGSRPHDLGDTASIVIENPFVRLNVLRNARDVVVDGTSLSGRGAMVEGTVDVVLEANDWAGRLEKWTNDISAQFGWYSSWLYKDKYRTDVDGIAKKLGTYHSKKEVEKPELEKAVDALGPYALKSIREYANEMIEGRRALEQREGGSTPGAGGAVIFGSGKYKADYSDLVYLSARLLGSLDIPVATGGSGGYMEVANAGAYGAGGTSIGIPVTTLKSESRIARGVQTSTLPTSGYKTRIPLLLYHRQLVIFAPGGSGTAKELAVAFVALSGASKKQHLPRLVFLSRSYFGKWEKMIQDFPRAVRDRISVVDSVDDFAHVVKSSVEDPQIEKTHLMGSGQIVPRNSDTKFSGSILDSKKDDSGAE